MVHRRALRSLRPDLLHVNLPNPFAARTALLAAYSLRVPTTVTEHLVFPSRRRRGSVVKRAMSWPIKAHVAVAAASAQQLIRFYGIRRSAIRVVHNGVPDETVQAIDFDVRPVVGCAARLEDQKRLDVLVRALVELIDSRLVLVGDGSRRSELESMAESLGVADRITFTGWLPDARPHIAGFDVFVLPSANEAFPLTILEAMLVGTPVVAADVGGVGEAIRDGTTGMLVAGGDVGAVVQAVRRLLEDDRLRAGVTAAAREVAVARFTAAAMAGRYDVIWGDVLAGRRHRRVT